MSDAVSISDLERRTAAQGQALAQSVAELRFHLQPKQLAGEAAHRLRDAVLQGTRTAASRVQTPVGIATTVTSLGFIAAAIIGRQGGGRRPSPDAAEDPGRSESTLADPVRALVSVVLALGLGIGMSKLASGSRQDSELLNGLSAEVKKTMDRWTRDQVDQFARPSPEEGFGLLNLIAMGLGIFAAPREPNDKP